MQAKALIDHHMTDCNQFRDNLRDDLRDFRDDLRRINWRMAMMLGGLVVLSHGVDYILALTGHK